MTTLYLVGSTWPSFDPTSDLDYRLSFTRGSGATARATTVTTSSIFLQATDGTGGTPMVWYSPPLQAVSITGTITVNFRGLESGMTVNAEFQWTISRYNNAGTSNLGDLVTRSTVDGQADDELGTAESAHNKAFSPFASQPLVNGDRIRVEVWFGGTASGFFGANGTCTIYTDGPTGGASGDSYVTFTETLTEYTAASLPPVRRIPIQLYR